MGIHPVSRPVLGCGLAFLLTASVGMTQQPKLPDGLKHVPLDAMGFIHFRAGEFLKSDLGKILLQEVRKDREARKGLKELEKTLGIEAADLESVTLLMLAPPARSQMNPWGGIPQIKPTDKEPGFEPKRRIELELQRRLEKEQAEKLEAVRRELEEARRRVEEALKRAIENEKKASEKKKDDVELDVQKPAAKESRIAFQEFERVPLPLGDEVIIGPKIEMFEQDIEMLGAFGSSGPLLIVTSAKPLDRKKILRAQLFDAKPRDPFYSPMSEEPSVLFLSDRTVMLGAPWELARYSEAMARKPKTEPLKSALALGAEQHLVIAGGHVPAEWRRLYFSPYLLQTREFAALAPLFQAEIGLALDLGKSVDLKFQFNVPTEAGAANAFQAVKSLRVLAELAIEKSREAGESGGAKLALEKALLKGLADSTIEQKGTTMSAELKVELGPAFYKNFMKDIVAQLRSRGDRTRSMNNLKQIGLALHAHHDAYKSLPPAGISDADGKPLLSWRVAILPYIEQQPLYLQFDLNQPWDHPTNKKLIAKMPQIYVVPGSDAKEGETNYRVLVGPGTAFEPRKGPQGNAVGLRIPGGFPDGTSNTIMAVEAREPTIWTKPDDLPYNPNGPLPKFGISTEGFNALMGDATVRFIRSTTREEVLRPYLTGNNGQVRQPLD